MIRLMLISIDVTGMIAIGLIIHVHKRAIVDQFERATRSILNNRILQMIFSLSFARAPSFLFFLLS
jgi:hypothetical protein